MPLSDEVKDRISTMVGDTPVMLFMKGSRALPQCGFSAAVVEVLDEYLPDYQTFNVLEDQVVREAIKEFSDWPTIPQLYVKGEFVGGCDIVREMHGNGELADVLGAKPMPIEPPVITLSDTAVAAFRDAASEEEHPHLRLEISPRFQYALAFGPAMDGDLVATSNGFEVRMDKGTARRANGLEIDFVEGPSGAGFKIENPNEPPSVKQLPPAAAKEKMGAAGLVIFDVRPPPERARASLPEAIGMDEGGMEKLAALPKDTPIAFLCHTGGRSQAAAMHFLAQGFTEVYNIAGGIDAWAVDVDPSLPRY